MRVTAYRSEKEARFEKMRQQTIAAEVRRKSEMFSKSKERIKTEQLYEKVLFCAWIVADKELERLEKIRDKHCPKSLFDEFDDEFCGALEKIQEVKELCKDIWFEYINYNR